MTCPLLRSGERELKATLGMTSPFLGNGGRELKIPRCARNDRSSLGYSRHRVRALPALYAYT
jgi:hypothetical protein